MAERKSFFRRYAQEILTGGVLMVLFSAFFWLGYVAGQTSAVQAAVPGSEPARAPAAERLVWRTVRN